MQANGAKSGEEDFKQRRREVNEILMIHQMQVVFISNSIKAAQNNLVTDTIVGDQHRTPKGKPPIGMFKW